MEGTNLYKSQEWLVAPSSLYFDTSQSNQISMIGSLKYKVWLGGYIILTRYLCDVPVSIRLGKYRLGSAFS